MAGIYSGDQMAIALRGFWGVYVSLCLSVLYMEKYSVFLCKVGTEFTIYS